MFRSLFVLLTLMFLSCPAQGQDGRKIPISFLPPPLETATYSLGIYETKSAKLVRHLQEGATQDAFTVGLNGLITNWDGKDDAGKPVPPGKYAARGYAVGALKVEGKEIVGNDWAADDEDLRITHVEAINLVSGTNTLAVFATMASGNSQWFGFDGEGQKAHPIDKPTQSVGTVSIGKDHTRWKIEEGILTQYSQDGEKMRQLVVKPGEPSFVAVAASDTDDRIYLLEEAPGWQRVRGLSWVETKQEEGKPVSTWQTFFERNIRMQQRWPWENSAGSMEVSLKENPLDPGKPQKAVLAASVDDQGSYLTTKDGLRLRRISQRANLKEAKLAKDEGIKGLSFYQSDGAAWDSFIIGGFASMMAFDAGEIDMTADGERTHSEKAAEPPDL